MTEVTLRDYFERILEEHRIAHLAEHRQLVRALDLASQSVDNRLSKLNELRSEVLIDRSEFVRRDVYDQGTETRDRRLSELENWRSRATGAAVILTLFAGVIGAAVMRAFGG